MVGVKGFEPSAPWSQTKCANQTALHPENRDDICHRRFEDVILDKFTFFVKKNGYFFFYGEFFMEFYTNFVKINTFFDELKKSYLNLRSIYAVSLLCQHHILDKG